MVSTGPDKVSPQQKKQRKRAAKVLYNARQRCTNPNDKDYKNYGAKGIQVLLTLDELIEAIGLPAASGLSVDRIDPNGHYELGNVRWASKAVQAANKKASPGGSTLPLHSLIAQQKLIVQQEAMRPKVAEAWHLSLKGFNYGKLSPSDEATLADNMNIAGSTHAVFGSTEVIIDGKPRVIFRLPSLTCPNELVTATGPSKRTPDAECARRFLRHGLLYRLRDVEGAANIPSLIHGAFEALRKDDNLPGLTLVGRPAANDLRSGWFEVWMLAAASRLPKFGTETALFPAITCLELLTEFGGPHKWDEVSHPLLDQPLLFIPDFQLDCGAWGNLNNYQFGTLERLLKYRIEMGHQTAVGVQAPHQLTSALQKILLGNFKVQKVANQTCSVSNLKF